MCDVDLGNDFPKDFSDLNLGIWAFYGHLKQDALNSKYEIFLDQIFFLQSFSRIFYLEFMYSPLIFFIFRLITR